ncbi:hypothetical protein DdX_13772 [Ditylenchus destructor]|uniref:Uncharacterized protein n=1 Tax=Ditylenchus destructor TaxID=166010 RepID=A0AAD4R2H9_9BILA|nr:hypothetical protein DdX_13772 [Ditylenchus destructor]
MSLYSFSWPSRTQRPAKCITLEANGCPTRWLGSRKPLSEKRGKSRKPIGSLPENPGSPLPFPNRFPLSFNSLSQWYSVFGSSREKLRDPKCLDMTQLSASPNPGFRSARARDLSRYPGVRHKGEKMAAVPPKTGTKARGV